MIKRSEWIDFDYCLSRNASCLSRLIVRTKTRESAKVLKVWEDEINGYITPSGSNNEIDDQVYLMQEIEVDAIAFAHWLVKKN